MPASHSILKAVRLIHMYIGIFIAPALLFFAFTGAIQTFSLHETTRGSDYKPPAILVSLGQLHKKQTIVLPPKRPQTPTAESKPRPAGEAAPPSNLAEKHEAAPAPKPLTPPQPPARQKNLLPMKLFFLLVSVGLFVSTLTGIYMSYKFNRNKSVITALLLAGIAVPVFLLFI